jgi:GDSL-like Lipase/Acylhydrolase family
MKTKLKIMRRTLLLLISLAILSCSPVSKYRNLPEVKAWENDIRKFEQLDNNEKYSTDAILFAGSSSIKLWSTLEQDMAPYPVIQRGYGGAKLSDFAVYADRIFAPHPCRAIVLFVANDITGGESDKSPKEVADLFRYVLMTIRKTHPDTPVYWIAITPTAARWSVWDQIQKANNAISEVCRQNRNTWFIRTDFAFLDEQGKPRTELFIDDKLHLNQKGYAIWTEIIKKELEKALPITR